MEEAFHFGENILVHQLKYLALIFTINPFKYKRIYNDFTMLQTLNSFKPSSRKTTYYQRNTFAVSFYPYIVVVEKNKNPRNFLSTLDFGTKMLEGSRHNWPRKPNIK